MGELSTRRAPLRAAGAVALAVAAFALRCATAQGAAPARQARGTPQEVVFTRYTPLFSNTEILRRLLSPLAEQTVRDLLARSHEALTPYPIDLAKEHFLVYVPPGAPPSPRGFALLVFVSPSEQANLPRGWTLQLNHYGVIFVTPERAGNADADLSRRVPLALSAEENIVREYPVDRDRIYIGGFSGGSRVAERTALGYPDVFSGALLNAGADPLGGVYPLPSRDLFQRFQSSSHLVYVTGERDTVNLDTDATSSQSMQDWCVLNVETDEAPNAGHEAMSSTGFGEALNRLLNHTPPDTSRLTVCRSHVEAALEEKLGHAEALLSADKQSEARKLLLEIDKQYGGLAAPRILQLAAKCACGLT